MSPRLTIGIPTHNSADTIARTLRSILSQSFTEWTAVLSDDRSEDGTVAVAREVIGDDHRFEIICQGRRLGVMNFCALLEKADTPLFVWLAGDDYWYPDYLRRTIEVLDANPGAVGAISQCLYQIDGRLTDDRPDTGSLLGNWSDRVCGFFENPNGTRMYGVFRTPELKASFPPRQMEGYDWALMASVLRHGDMIELPAPLLVRDRTPWQKYTTDANSAAQSPLHARFPLLDMSFHLLRTRNYPMTRKALATLYRLNRSKEEEAVYLTDPAGFLTRQAMFRARGLPLASNPVHRVKAARGLLEDPQSKPDAAKIAMTSLKAMADEREVLAEVAYGRALARNGSKEETAKAWPYLRSAARKDPDAAYDLLEYERNEALTPVDTLCAKYLDLAEKGSAFAAARAGFLLVRGLCGSVDEWRLYALLETARSSGSTAGTHPLAWMTEHGRGCRQDLPLAMRLYREAVENNPSAHRDLARLCRDCGDIPGASEHYIQSIASGAEWSVVDLVNLYPVNWPRDGYAALNACLDVLAQTRDGTLRRKLTRMLSKIETGVWPDLLAHNHRMEASGPIALRDHLVEAGACPPTSDIDLGVAVAILRGA